MDVWFVSNVAMHALDTKWDVLNDKKNVLRFLGWLKHFGPSAGSSDSCAEAEERPAARIKAVYGHALLAEYVDQFANWLRAERGCDASRVWQNAP